MTRLRRFRTISLSMLLLAPTSYGQKGGGASAANQTGQQNAQGGGQTGQSASPSGGAGTLPGLTYSVDSWSSLGLPDVKGPAKTFTEGRAVLCYKLIKANSGNQPFILQPMSPADIHGSGFERPCGPGGIAESDTTGKRACKGAVENHWSACTLLDDKHPLLMGQELVIGVEVSDLGLTGANPNQIKAININVTNAASSALNPSPLRPSFPGSGSGGAGGGSTGSFGTSQINLPQGEWWIEEGKINPGTDTYNHWAADTPYKKGAVVSDVSGTRLYRASSDFTSGPPPTDPFPPRPRADRIKDGTIIWQEVNGPLAGKNPKAWHENTPYDLGDVVKVVKKLDVPDVTRMYFSSYVALAEPSARTSKTGRAPVARPGRPPETYYYRAMTKGRSGQAKDPLSVELVPRAVYVAWPFQLPGDAIPTFNVNLIYSPPTPGTPWQGNTFYPAGSVVISSGANGHYYTSLTGGFSQAEPHEPDFPIDVPPTTQDGDLFWLDSGSSPPSSGGGGGSGGGQGSASPQGTGGAAANPSAGKAQLWLAHSHYSIGDVILDPYNGHYFTMIRSKAGTSGPKPATGADPFPPSRLTIRDGDLLLMELPSNPGGIVVDWKPGIYFGRDVVVHTPAGGYFKMIGSGAASGISGTTVPLLTGPLDSAGHILDGSVAWMDSGQTSSQPTWKPATSYSLGDSANFASKVYIVAAAGASGKVAPGGPDSAGTLVSDGDLLWMDLGLGADLHRWAPTSPFQLGQTVLASNGHVYQVTRFTAGVSGPSPDDPQKSQPDFKILRANMVVDAAKLDVPLDNGILWKDAGMVKPPAVSVEDWQPGQHYPVDSYVHVPGFGNGRYYIASTEGKSNVTSPFLNLVPAFPLIWQSSGTTAPSLVTGASPADQTVSLINLGLPQTHSLSYFNVSAGVIGVLNRYPVFGYVPATSQYKAAGTVPGPVPVGTAASSLSVDAASGCTVNPTTKVSYFCPGRTGYASRSVDPTLALTLYFPPVDAERQLQLKNWRDWVPGLTFGGSLTNPSTRFYIGGSNEIGVRNVQLFWGWSWQNVAKGLANKALQPPYAGGPAVPAVLTVSGFQRGYFIGVTYNISNFIQNLGLKSQ